MEERELDKTLTARHLSIIGDPGSGKTTFLRYMAFLLARGLLQDDDSCEKLGLGKGSFPLWIKTDEFCQYLSGTVDRKQDNLPLLSGSPDWLPCFLEEKNRDLKWGFGRDFFRQKLAVPGTVLLIDGLDEAPDQKLRERVSRGNNITFWHLTFLEYLAVLALGGKVEVDYQQLLVKPEILHAPAWREVLLLFGGVLYTQGPDKLNSFLQAILDLAATRKPSLADEGLIDMSGNVWEWCRDWYGGSGFYERSKGSVDPVNDTIGKLGIVGEKKYRILRGGCWASYIVRDFRCAYRYYDYPDFRFNLRGFRVILLFKLKETLLKYGQFC